MSSNGHTTRAVDLGRDPIGPLLCRLALPTITAQVVNLLYNIVDRIYIGRIPLEGKLALTGMGVTFPVITLISAFSALVGMGGAPRASIALGAGEKGRAERTLGTCATALWGIAAALTVLFLLFQRDLLRLFGASADTLPYAMQYLSIYVLGTVFVMTALGLNGFITAQGSSAVAMKTVVIGAVLNVVLDPLFIFVLHMGVRGAAVATVLSQAVSAAWVLRFLTGKNTVLRLRRSTLRIDTKLLLPAVSLGASPFVMQSTESLLTVAFNVSLQKYGGDLAVGAMTILTSVAQMIQLPLTGLAQGAQPILSYNFGAHRPDRMKQVVRYNILIAVLFAVSIWGVVQLAPHAVVHLFTSDEQLTEITVWALRIYMALGFTNAFQTGFQQSFVALGEAKISLFLALERKIFLLIPLIFILPHFFADKLFAVFLAEPVADVLAAATTTVLFLIRFRKITKEM
nr:MATE family efflux transporter [uncultured Agathobaculum sp.]